MRSHPSEISHWIFAHRSCYRYVLAVRKSESDDRWVGHAAQPCYQHHGVPFARLLYRAHHIRCYGRDYVELPAATCLSVLWPDQREGHNGRLCESEQARYLVDRRVAARHVSDRRSCKCSCQQHCYSPGSGQKAQHPRHLRRRHRLLEHQRLQPRHDGLPHAQHRPHRQGRRDLHRPLRPAVLHRRARRVHHRAKLLPHRPAQGRPAAAPRKDCPRRTRRSPNCSSRRATPPASSARTTSATATSSCRRSTASTSSSATSTTSTPRRSRRTRTTRRTPSSGRSSARAAC